MWLGMPIGPTTACSRVPTRQFCCISRVVLPTAWITSVIVPLVTVEVGDRQRDALAVLVLHHDDELARPGGPGHQRMADLEQVGDVGEILARHDLEVGHAATPRSAVLRPSWPLSLRGVVTLGPTAA